MTVYKICFTLALFSVIAAESMEGTREDREKETEGGAKRGRQEETREVRQPERKKQRSELTPEEQEKMNLALYESLFCDIRSGDSSFGRSLRALDGGADANAIGDWQESSSGCKWSLLETTLSDLDHPYPLDVKTRILALNFLLENGSLINNECILEALDAHYCEPKAIELLFHYGADCRDPDLLSFLCQRVIDNYQKAPSDDCYVNDDCDSDNRFNFDLTEVVVNSAGLLWLLLRMEGLDPQSNFLADTVANYGSLEFTTPDVQKMTLTERLGPLVLALMEKKHATAHELIEDLAERFAIDDRTKLHISAALVLVAATGQLEILTLLVTKLKKFLRAEFVIEAMQAASLTGQPKTFEALVDSGLIFGDQLKETVQNALFVAVGQRYEQMVKMVLYFDRIENLNLAIMPAGHRVAMLLRGREQEKIASFIAAAGSGDLERLKSILDAGSIWADEYTGMLVDALQVAHRNGQEEVVNYILDIGAYLELNCSCVPEEYGCALARQAAKAEGYIRLRALLVDHVRDRIMRRINSLKPYYVEKTQNEIAEKAKEILAREKKADEARFNEVTTQLTAEEMLAREIDAQHEEIEVHESRLREVITRLEAEEIERRESIIRQTAAKLIRSDEEKNEISGTIDWLDFVRRVWGLPRELIAPIFFFVKFGIKSPLKV